MSSSAPDHSGTLRTLLTLAWPIVIARASQSVIGFCDALMTAKLGEDQLAAVTTGALNVFYVAILPMGVVFIVQSFASQLKAKGDMVAARRYAWYGLGIAAVAAVIALATIPLIHSIIGVFGFSAAVKGFMGDYMAIRLLALGGIIGIEVIGNWYGGLGNTRLHMAAGLLAMVLNVFLNWVLIYGNLGAPALGVEGAAWASTIASWVAFAFLAFVFWKRWWIEDFADADHLGLNKRELGRMLRFGLPNGLNWFLEFSAFILFMNVVVAHLGTTVIAAMMVVFNINSVSFMPAFGLSSAGAILVGQAIGSDERDSVAGILKRTVAVAAVWQGTVGLFYIAIPSILMGWFAPEGPSAQEMIEIGAVMLMISAAWQLFDSLGMAVSEALRAAGDTAWCLYARLVVAWVLFVPGSTLTIFVFGGGHISAMIWLVIYLGVLSLAFLWRFRKGAWRNIDLTGVEKSLMPDDT